MSDDTTLNAEGARIVKREEIEGAMVRIAPDEPWPLISGDWFTALCRSHEALRAEVERLTADRDEAREALVMRPSYNALVDRVAALTKQIEAQREFWAASDAFDEAVRDQRQDLMGETLGRWHDAKARARAVLGGTETP